MEEGVCPFSTDKRYATTQVKAPPQLQKTGAVRVLPVSHGFVYEPYALHEKISWCRKSTVSVQTRRRRLRPDPPSTSLSRSVVSVQIHEAYEIETQNLKMLNPQQKSQLGAVRVLPVSHGFVYEPYALHEKISWWRKCLYVTYGSLRSLYSTQELVAVSVAILNFLQRI
ncbi:hypothetical protein DY000_02014892 [Brassica cretica]|uniref:Uncharacterized protein n=1 Tax=Brassica cretica TaxID=69181 RepID=A0ABQ7CT73_BRACR|nr:hypothetical protein DY000_02014892 [Brassica cretica]